MLHSPSRGFRSGSGSTIVATTGEPRFLAAKPVQSTNSFLLLHDSNQQSGRLCESQPVLRHSSRRVIASELKASAILVESGQTVDILLW